MEELNNQNEEIIQNRKEKETNENPEDTVLDPEKESSAESTLEHPDHKKEKTLRSKHRKEDKVEEMEQEVAQWNDKYLRLYSEFDNYRKRSLKERIELSKTAASDLITALLPVLDDFERALSAMDTSEEKENPMLDGINLIYGKLKNILSQQGLERMKATGEEFNTDYHEALTNIPAPKPELKGKVVDVIQNGYLLNGTVIRYAKVVVGN
ncbi:MAG: nucleotide exchange factor GrpE [Bacteroidetes bacterium]|nr:nucleotide exchange factor GrpE [Bacteroidota bacterium]